MNVKCSKNIKFIFLFGWIITILAPLLIFIDAYNRNSEVGMIIAAILALLCQILMISSCFTLFKSARIDEVGITVKFLSFKKLYTWDKIKTKSIETYDQRLFGTRDSYKKGCVFSTKEKFHTPEMLSIVTYLFSCINPWRFVSVLFTPKDTKGIGLFEIDEKLFMEKMNEWGIELSEYKNGKFAPYRNYAGKINEAEASQETEETNKLK